MHDFLACFPRAKLGLLSRRTFCVHVLKYILLKSDAHKFEYDIDVCVHTKSCEL